jgi:hypothetical protein
MKNFEQYLSENFEKNIIDHRIRSMDGKTFYIHPDSHDGDTLDFTAKGNTLLLINQPPVNLGDIRKQFIEAIESADFAGVFMRKPSYLVVAVKLPTGAIELITNTDQLQTKVDYYRNAYDDNFCLITNPVIQIVGFMLV